MYMSSIETKTKKKNESNNSVNQILCLTCIGTSRIYINQMALYLFCSFSNPAVTVCGYYNLQVDKKGPS